MSNNEKMFSGFFNNKILYCIFYCNAYILVLEEKNNNNSTVN